MPDDDRLALAARLATTAPAAAALLADAVDDGEELREVLVDLDGEVVALTDRRALFAGVREAAARAFDYAAVEVRRRANGLGIDAIVEGDRLVLDVARSTFVRLGVVAEGNPPARATWLPVRAPTPRPVEELLSRAAPAAPGASAVPPEPPDPEPAPSPVEVALPPPGWHPDPSGRHWWRWWDGGGWTDHVADGGPPYLDRLPPR